MISTAKSKLIRSLRQKKFRDQLHLFMAEGEKMVLELARRGSETQFQIKEIFATGKWIEEHEKLLNDLKADVCVLTTAEIKKLSNFLTPQPVMALVSIPDNDFSAEKLLHIPVLAFEAIRDPGNLGTIIRTADWFGIRQIICTPDSTDLYNPKVVQSTMGSITRVQVDYLDIETLLGSSEIKGKPVFGTFLTGNNIYEASLGPDPLILFGNESHGLSGRFDHYIHQRISIPYFSRMGHGSESLNVASSVAVICSELRRR
jgi:TrmH family RNA methyltransferase